MTINLRSPLFLALLLIIALTGCASKTDNFSARLSQQGESATSIAERYSKGEKLISNGEAQIKKGKKLVNRGENQQSDGQNMISRGEELKRAAKEEYCQQDRYQDPACE